MDSHYTVHLPLFLRLPSASDFYCILCCQVLQYLYSVTIIIFSNSALSKG